MPSLHPRSHPAISIPTLASASRPVPELVSGEEPLCANATCRNLVLEVWEETGRYCARCAIEKDLYDRDSRRERAFPRLF